MSVRAKRPAGAARALLFCALAAVFYAAPSPVFAQQTEAPRSGVLENDLFKARELQARRDWTGLRNHAWEWARKDPDEWRAWRFLGEAERELGQLAEAVEAFREAEKNRPLVRGQEREDDALLVAVADLQARDGLDLEAENSYLLALKKNDGNVDTWRKLSDLRLRLAEDAEDDSERRRLATETLGKVMAFPRFVNDYERWRKYGELLDGLGDNPEEARAAYANAVRLKPQDAALWERIVLLDLDAGRRESALAGMRSLLRADAANVVANAYLGEKALADGFVEEAKAHFGRVAAAVDGDLAARTKAHNHLIDLAETPEEKLGLHKALLRVDASLWSSWDYVIVQTRGLGDRESADAMLRNKTTARLLAEKGEPIPPGILP